MFSHRDGRRVQTSGATEAGGEAEGVIAQVNAALPRSCQSAISCHNQLELGVASSATDRILSGLASALQDRG